MEMFRSVFALSEEPGRLDDDVRPELLPRQICRFAFLDDFEALAACGDGVAIRAHGLLEITQNGVVFEKVRERRCVRDVVGGDDVDLAISHGRAKNVTPDAAEPVDAYLDCHPLLLIEDSSGPRPAPRQLKHAYRETPSE